MAKLRFAALFLFLIAGSVNRLPAQQDIPSEFEKTIPQLMSDQNVPGLAIAVVDEKGVLWHREFGVTDYASKQPVTVDTIFSIQSMSKTFTATAVLIAAQEGLVDLDTPLAAHLPAFRVNSCFEKEPEKRITLRQLLSHTAGFAHEAPVGNNFELESGTFEEHVSSIANTWLRFPVGENYAYSNLGIDLAGYIVQVRSGMSLDRFLRLRLFEPLGMPRSTLDPLMIERERNRAHGHEMITAAVPVRVPMMAAGGVYTSAADLARFIIFQLNGGRTGNQQILQPKYFASMYETPRFAGGRTGGYTLGLARMDRPGPPLWGHSGGGFGFRSDMYWYPDLGIGGLLLTNSSEHGLQQNILFQVLDRYVEDDRMVYKARKQKFAAAGAPKPAFADTRRLLRESNRKRLEPMLLAVDEAQKARWGAFAGDYRYRIWGHPAGILSIRFRNGHLEADDRILYPLQDKLFMTDEGDTLDLRGAWPLWRNIPLDRFVIPLWQKTLLVLSLLLLPVALLAWPVGAIYRRIRGRARPKPEARWFARLMLGVVALDAILSVLLFVFLMNFPYMINGGWLEPTPIMPLPLIALLKMPVVIGILTAIMVIVAVAISRSGSWPRGFKQHYAVVSLGAVLVVALMASWGLFSR